MHGLQTHVVVGPGGVVVLTRMRGRRYESDNGATEQACVAAASSAAAELAALLPPRMRRHVVAVLCLRRGPVEPVPNGDVLVCGRRAFVRWLQTRPVVLAPGVAETLASALRPVPEPRRSRPARPVSSEFLPPRPESGLISSPAIADRDDREVSRLLLVMVAALFLAGGGVSATRDWFGDRLAPSSTETTTPGPQASSPTPQPLQLHQSDDAIRWNLLKSAV